MYLPHVDCIVDLLLLVHDEIHEIHEIHEIDEIDDEIDEIDDDDDDAEYQVGTPAPRLRNGG